MADTKKAFGGYQLLFEGRTETMEQVMGSVPVSPADMTKKLWAWVKKHKLSNK